ncbi:MAG: hypothetical protein ABI551_17620 [Polyangiaceae bacterium]
MTPRPISQRRFADRSLLFVLSFVWLASLGRVLLEALRHRPFGVEATLAVAMALLVPFALWGATRSYRRDRS